MKKILLSFGVASLAIIPVISVVSCGSKTTKVIAKPKKVVIAATASETQKDMKANISKIRIAFNNLTLTELKTPAKVIAALQKAIPEAMYQNIITGIKNIKFIPGQKEGKLSIMITLVGKTATTKAVEITISDITPKVVVQTVQKSWSQLVSKIAKLTHESKVIQTALKNLTTTSAVKTALEKVVTDQSYWKAIDSIDNVTYGGYEQKTIILSSKTGNLIQITGLQDSE